MSSGDDIIPYLSDYVSIRIVRNHHNLARYHQRRIWIPHKYFLMSKACPPVLAGGRAYFFVIFQNTA